MQEDDSLISLGDLQSTAAPKTGDVQNFQQLSMQKVPIVQMIFSKAKGNHRWVSKKSRIDNNISKAHLFKTASKFLTNKHTKKKRVPEHFDPRDFPTDA